MGVIVPDIDTAEEAAKVVYAAKFPPLGHRPTYANLPQASMQNLKGQKFLDDLNKETTVAIMIETLDALKNIDSIAAVPGVDILFIGSQDMTAALGYPGDTDNPGLMDVFDKVIAAAKKHNKHVGIGGMSANPKKIETLVKKGALFISAGTDMVFLMQKATEVSKANLALNA